MTPTVDVGAVDEFPADTIRLVSVAGKAIGVVRRGDRVFAFRTRCPHQQGPLEHGRVMERVVARGVGQLDLEEPPVVVCPWHGWEFDVDSGTALCDPSLRVAVYPARIDAGRILVDPEPRRRTS